MNEIIQKEESTDEISKIIVFSDSKLKTSLTLMGLPTENLFADTKERILALKTFSEISKDIPQSEKEYSTYLSKFYTLVYVGLFDAALNYLWDAIVLHVREKIKNYDIAYFFDSHPNQNISSNQDKTSTELDRISDEDLIQGAKEIEILADTSFQKIQLIKYLRNHASAAHPNSNMIRGLELIGYVDFCIKDLFAKDYPNGAINTKEFIKQIKKASTLNQVGIKLANERLASMNTDQIDSLLKAITGLYLDPDSNSITRNNIFNFAKKVWDLSSKKAKNEIGARYAYYSLNQMNDKINQLMEFLDKVQGRSYLPEDVRKYKLQILLDSLNTIHRAADNFYNEAPIASDIEQYLLDTKAPDQLKQKLVSTIISCRMGNGYGVARRAQPTYDHIIDLFEQDEIKYICQLPLDPEIHSQLQFEEYARKVFINILTKVKPRSSGLSEQILTMLSVQENYLMQIIDSKDFSELTKKLDLV